MLIAELHASGGGESAPPLFVGPDARLLLQGQPDIVQAFKQEFAPEIINFEARQEAGGVANFPLLQVNGEEIPLQLAVLRTSSATWESLSTTGSTPFLVQLVEKISAKEGAITARNP